jgi:hypothetical protein
MTADGIVALSSSDVTAIVGITPIYLNALVHRKLYGIAASISDQHGEMKIRIFSEEDVFGIALVWMLFESGLRTQSIREILLQVVETDEPDANAAAESLALSGVAHLLIIREPSKSKKKKTANLLVEPTLIDDLVDLVENAVAEHRTAAILLVPVGARFAEIENKIKRMYPE